MAANTLTGLIPDLYQAIDIVSRELTGCISAVALNASGSTAAKDQTIRIPITPEASAGSITPANYSPSSGNQTIGYTDITIASSRMVPIQWQGEESKGFGHTGTKQSTIGKQFTQAMRTLTNEVEVDLCELYTYASRAYGTAATTPFSASLGSVAQAKKILDDNGCPPNDRHMVINTTAGANLRSLANLNQANTAGTDATLRRGVLLPVMGFDLRESAQVQLHTTGDATGADLSVGVAVGDTTLYFNGADGGTVLAGDTLKMALDANYYMVQSATLSATSVGNVVIAKPGAMETGLAAAEGSFGADYTANMFFHRDAIQLITRGPAMPDGGDEADDVINITDPVSGITFQVALYRQYRQVHYEIGLAWGCALIKPEHAGILMG